MNPTRIGHLSSLALVVPAIVCLVLATATDAAAAPPPEQLEYFETHIRPVLVKYCYECHAMGAKTVRGDLLLDTRGGIREGGDSGPAVVPTKPDESLLLEAIRYESFEMPPDGTRC